MQDLSAALGEIEKTIPDNNNMSDLQSKLVKAIELIAQGQANSISVKPEIGTYDGTRSAEKVLAFISKLESTFEIKGMVKEQDKILYFARHLEGSAQIWWSAVHNQFANGGYKQLIAEFKENFIDANYMINLKRRFFSMRQTGSVAGYVTAFRDICRQLEPGYAGEELCKDLFLNGLIPNVQSQVRAQQPMSVEAAIMIALEVGSVTGTNAKGIMRKNNLGYSPMDVDNVELDDQGNFINVEAFEQSRGDMKCFFCKKRGHLKRDCIKRKKYIEQLKGQGQSA